MFTIKKITLLLMGVLLLALFVSCPVDSIIEKDIISSIPTVLELSRPVTGLLVFPTYSKNSADNSDEVGAIVSWVPPKDIGKGTFKGYLVEFREKTSDASVSWKPVLPKKVGGGQQVTTGLGSVTSRIFTITPTMLVGIDGADYNHRMKLGTAYEFRVIPVTTVGRGPVEEKQADTADINGDGNRDAMNEITVTENLPPSPVLDIEVEKVLPTEITVSWKYSKSQANADGKTITKYKVQYREITDVNKDDEINEKDVLKAVIEDQIPSSAPKWHTDTVDASTTVMRIAGLEAGKTYAIRILGYDGKKSSSWGKPIVRTMEFGLGNLVFDNTNAGELKITWDVSGLASKMIRGYKIMYKRVSEDDYVYYDDANNDGFVDTEINRHLTVRGASVTLTRLEGDIAYDVKVSAIVLEFVEEDLQRISYSQEGTAHIIAGLPGQVTTLRVQERTGTTVILTWKVPNTGDNVINDYEIYYQTETGDPVLVAPEHKTFTPDITRTPAAFGTTIEVRIAHLPKADRVPEHRLSFTVAATSDVGNDKKRAVVSKAASIGDAPRVPLHSVTIFPGNTWIELAWEAPVNNSGSPIVGYLIEKFITVGNSVIFTSVIGRNSPPIGTTTINTVYKMTGLVHDAEYIFIVRTVTEGSIVKSGRSRGIEGRLTCDISTPPPKGHSVFLTPPKSFSSEAGPDKRTEIILHWKTPVSTGTDSSGGPASIDKYVIEYSKGARLSATPTQIDIAATTETTYTITGLTEGTPYTLRIVVFTKNGSTTNSASTCASTVTTLRSKPEGASGFKGKYHNSGTAVSLTWTAPTMLGTNRDGSTAGTSVVYTLSYQEKGSSAKPTTVTPAPTGTSHMVGGLDGDKSYVFRLSVMNNFGVEADGQISYTSEIAGEKPSMVQHLKIVQPTRSIPLLVRVAFQRSVYAGTKALLISARITKYQLRVSKDKNFNTIVYESTISSTDTHQLMEVRGLISDQQYYFGVTAINSVGSKSDEKVAPYTVKRMLDMKPAVPRNVHVAFAQGTPHNAVTVRWQAPEHAGTDSKGKGESSIQSYKVEYSKGTTKIAVTPKTKSVSALTTTILSLEPETDYVFSVFAINAAGLSSDPTATKTIRTQKAPVSLLPGVPTQVQATPSGVDKSDTAAHGITITWTTPTMHRNAPALTSYKITIGDTPEKTVTSSIEGVTFVPGKRSSYRVNGLSPHTSYAITIKAVNEAGESVVSTPITVTTAKVIIGKALVALDASLTTDASSIINLGRDTGVAVSSKGVTIMDGLLNKKTVVSLEIPTSTASTQPAYIDTGKVVNAKTLVWVISFGDGEYAERSSLFSGAAFENQGSQYVPIGPGKAYPNNGKAHFYVDGTEVFDIRTRQRQEREIQQRQEGWYMLMLTNSDGLDVRRLGTVDDLSVGFKGYVAELLLYEDVLSVSDRASLWTHLQAKWALSAGGGRS